MAIDRLFSVFKTAQQGMAVQRRQVMVSSENIANSNTTNVNDSGEPYRPKELISSQRSESGEFKSQFNKSRLSLRRTRNNHMNEEIRENRQGNTPPNRGPQDSVEQVDRYRYEYDPEHPDADENGMVKYPDLDLVEEMTKIVSANRLFEANMAVVQAEKQVLKQSLQI